MDTTIEMSTTLSKIRNVAGNGVTRESAILLSNIPVRFPIRQMGALSISNHTITTISGLMKKYGEWGILYSKVYIITRIKNANIEDVRDYGISGEDGSIFSSMWKSGR